MDRWALIVGMAVALVGVSTSVWTLYLNFLKRAKLNLHLGKSAVLVFHDTALELCPMIDVFCTLVNQGARSGVVDRLALYLKHDNSTVRFNDYGFLKVKNGKDWILEEHAHPLVVNKYSEESRMVMFKSERPTYGFDQGPYSLTIEARSDGRRVDANSVDFAITPAKAEEIQGNRKERKNGATEISLI